MVTPSPQEFNVSSRLAASSALVFVLVLLSACAPSSSGQSGRREGPLEGFALGKLQADFRQLQGIVEKQHPNLYGEPEVLSAVFDRQYALLREGMDELTFYRLLTPPVVALRCGHTAIRVSKGFQTYLREEARYLPFEVRVIGGRIHVLRDLASAGIPAGSEILELNGRSAEEIVSILLAGINAEGANLTRKYYVMNHGFAGAYLFFVELTDSYEVLYRSPGESRSLSVTVPGIRNQAMAMSVIGFFYTGEETGAPYSGTITGDYGSLTVRSFSTGNRRSYEHFVEDFFSRLREQGISNLILDLRGNWGGPPGPAIFLYSHLIDEPSRYFGGELPFYFFFLNRAVESAEHRFAGKLYVLIDGACFSTTGHLISLLKYHGRATFIGEESASSWICSDGARNYTLKNTGIRLYCATRVFQTAVSGMPMGRGLLPDREVIPTLADVLEGIDPAMLRAVELAPGVAR
jgi:hypothetical protein